jgi:hypothetical protein
MIYARSAYAAECCYSVHRGNRPPVAISLPISQILGSGVLSLHRQDEIAAALQVDPQGLRAGKAIVLALEKAAEAGYHPNHLLQ